MFHVKSDELIRSSGWLKLGQMSSPNLNVKLFIDKYIL